MRPCHIKEVLHEVPGCLILDFFPPSEILKLFCIVKTFTCFPDRAMCVFFTITVVGLDGVFVTLGGILVFVLTPGVVMSLLIVVVGRGVVPACVLIVETGGPGGPGGISLVVECTVGEGHMGKP